MSNQEKKAFLSQYQEQGREVQRLQEEIGRWEALACKVTAGISATGGDSGQDKIQTAVEKIIGLQEQLAQQAAEWVRLRETIERGICSVQDLRLQQLLRYRYIEGWTWERIAVEMHYQYRWILVMHGRALQKVNIEMHIKPVL